MSRVEWVEWKGWDTVKPTIRRGPHRLTKKLLNWKCCARCGLVALKNEATRDALRKE